MSLIDSRIRTRQAIDRSRKAQGQARPGRYRTARMILLGNTCCLREPDFTNLEGSKGPQLFAESTGFKDFKDTYLFLGQRTTSFPRTVGLRRAPETPDTRLLDRRALPDSDRVTIPRPRSPAPPLRKRDEESRGRRVQTLTFSARQSEKSSSRQRRTPGKWWVSLKPPSWRLLKESEKPS